MKTTTKTAVKAKSVQAPAPQSTASKAPEKAQPSVVKAPAKPRMLAYTQLLMDALTGKFGPLVARYYSSAIKNHAKLKTVFPRPRNAAEGLMPATKAAIWLEAKRETSIEPGNKCGQRLFDEMMVQAKQQNMLGSKGA